jgi:hypothetical protein
MHRLHPGDGDGAAFLDQVDSKSLRRRRRVGRRVTLGEQPRHGVHGEVGWPHTIQLAHATGNDTGTPGRTRGL